ncbi:MULTISPECIES: A/G-specific adenine glycosylase [Sporosarcina]|uniref:A/G-specific adenine glycosylase n=1 Tax=Sporosarcina TaxID=1569 RepID=UPI00058CCCEC|nr:MULTISPECIES: A/G-specific adenine glycosylase [Sporosarcina]WJY27658.1 A/G-specific adenine glycosylase [Sporosarcina sp. 0.2-SM1T-5]
MNIDQKEEFNKRLLAWYAHEKRDLPWRRTSDPYKIWVSEVMLQQTRVETVIPFYNRFLESFPSMEALAYADEENVLKHWEGLGYYSRVRNLQAGVREVVEQYGGEIPRSRKDILKLKGIGPYTAGSVLSIAFGIPEHAVDGNVMRVFSRLFLIREDIAIPKTKKVFEEKVMQIIDETDPSSFNQAVMELGATICTPRPRCLLCPVREFCDAFEEGIQEELPVKTKKTKNRSVDVRSFGIRDLKGRWLLRKRPSGGLLGDFYEFPQIEDGNGAALSASLADGSGLLAVVDETPFTEFKHAFSHVTWQVSGHFAELLDESPLPKGYCFFTEDDLESLPKSKPMNILWAAIKN